MAQPRHHTLSAPAPAPAAGAEPTAEQHLALELTLRESLEGLYELATYFAYRSQPGTLEILSIEPAGDDPYARDRAQAGTGRTPPHAIPLNRPVPVPAPQPVTARSHDIVSYLMERERLSA